MNGPTYYGFNRLGWLWRRVGSRSGGPRAYQPGKLRGFGSWSSGATVLTPRVWSGACGIWAFTYARGPSVDQALWEGRRGGDLS